MTLYELITEIESLGGGDVMETREQMLSAANRALRELYLHIPVIKTVKFYARGYKPLVHYKEILCTGDAPITIPTTGKAFSMRVVGKGNYTLNDGDKTEIFQFDTGKESKLIRGFLTHGGYIRFWGGFSFGVYDFSLYNEIYSPLPESIPDGSDTTIYDIRGIYSDFLTFTSLPKDKDGNVIESCKLRDGIMEIDSEFRGEISLTYRRNPSLIDGLYEDNDVNEIVDINNEYSHLLAYLTWYQYWFNTDESKAKIYKNKFDNLLSAYNENYKCIDKAYIDVNGWA